MCRSTQCSVLGCTTGEQFAVIRFLWSDGVKPFEIHRRMLAQYGENHVTPSKICHHVEKGSEVAELASLMKTTRAVRPLHEQWTVLNELMFHFKRTDGLLSLM
jgi:hypothetical protein